MILSLYRVELRRLLLSRSIWLITILCLCSPLLGYSVYRPVNSEIMSVQYIGNPVLASTTIGAILWAMLTILEASCMRRAHTSVLMNTSTLQNSIPIVRMLSLMTISAGITLLCALIYLPVTIIKMDYLFHFDFYCLNYLIFIFPTWWISIFVADGLYQITHRVKLTFLLYAMLCYVSFSNIASTDYFMRWVNPFVVTYSDGFSSLWPLRMGLYTRLIWLCLSIGMWFFSLLCIRKYEKNLACSLLKGLRRIGMLTLTILFTSFGVLLWKNQPFIDHGSKEIGVVNLPSEDTEFFSSVHYSIEADPLTGTISGRAEYQVNKPFIGETVFWLNPGYKIISMSYGDVDVEYKTIDDDICGKRSTYFTLPDKQGETLTIVYRGLPTIKRATSSFHVDNSIDTDYIALEEQATFPLMRNYINMGYTTMEMTLPDNLVPYIDTMPLTNYVDNQDGTRTYTVTDVKHFIQFIAANFVTEKFTAEGIYVNFLYGEAYRTAVEKNNVKQAIADLFTYCTQHYGPYSNIDQDNLVLLQKSSMFMGGYAFPGMSQWFENVLAPDTLNDSAKGHNANEVFMHEMIHQWWGGYGLICKEDDLWSCEGLTVYSTYRLVKEKYGELYARQYYIEEWERAVEEQNRSFYYRHPEYMELLPHAYQTELCSINRGINWYKRMPLMILKAEKLVGGEEKMDEILSQIYADRMDYVLTPFTYQDFLTYCGLTEEELKLD